jgi:hypothetical protein
MAGTETFQGISCLVSMGALWKYVIGGLIICWTLCEVFNDLFQPSASGSLSSFIGRKLFHIGKFMRSVLASAGALSIAVVIAGWVGSKQFTPKGSWGPDSVEH